LPSRAFAEPCCQVLALAKPYRVLLCPVEPCLSGPRAVRGLQGDFLPLGVHGLPWRGSPSPRGSPKTPFRECRPPLAVTEGVRLPFGSSGLLQRERASSRGVQALPTSPGGVWLAGLSLGEGTPSFGDSPGESFTRLPSPSLTYVFTALSSLLCLVILLFPLHLFTTIIVKYT
jgi:hypothetical protein